MAAPFTHQGAWTDSARAHPTLAFLEKYTQMIKTRDPSASPTAFYAPSSIFYNGDGAVYTGSDAIWGWIKQLFAPFSDLGELDSSRRITVLPGKEFLSPGKGVIDLAEGGGAVKDEQKGDLVYYEHEMIFYFKDPKLERNVNGVKEGITVRRCMEFVVGPAEVKGQGTEGRQIWRGKVWWDSGVLYKEIENRRKMF